MSFNWSLTLSPSPPLTRWNDLMSTTDLEGTDTYITLTPLFLDTDIPGIPSAYATSALSGLALYVRGVPQDWKSSDFRSLFEPFGEVGCSPTLISLSTEETFRWVVMRDKEEARDAMEAMHGSVLESEKDKLCVSWALGSDRTVTLVNKELIEAEGAEESELQESPTIHGHPSPPAPSKPLLPPIPKIWVPLNVLKQPAVQTEEVNSESSTSISSPAETTPITDTFVSQATSWANIAGAANPETRIVDLHPEHKTVSAGPRLHPVGRIPSVGSSHEELMAEQMRLIFLLNLPNNITLHDITQAVREGPLVRIQFGHDNDENTRFAGIIFQYARDAESFYHVLCKEHVESRPDRFRFIVDVVRGDPIATDETIKAMSVAPFATRRLTIVKGQFFFMFGERKLKDLCVKLVGEENVQLIWLYNGGNATVVFADVASAIKVKKELDRRAAGAGMPGGESSIWRGLQTTFSKDPCIHPLDLKTAMRD